jgi:hypothetical protein
VEVSVATGAGVEVSVGTGVAVGVTVGTGALQLSQHEATTVPPRLVHNASDASGRHRLVTADPGSWHATLPSRFPHVERIAQPSILVRHFFGKEPSRTSRFTTRLTHAVYRPWFFASSHGHSVSIVDWTVQRAASQSTGSALARAVGRTRSIPVRIAMASFMSAPCLSARTSNSRAHGLPLT